MIIDCTIFNDELEILEFRLDCLAEAVDRFVIVEADRTFSGRPKPLILRAALDRWPDKHHRIRLIEVTDMPNNPNAWVREAHQRNAIERGLEDAAQNDLVLISDLDEIPNIAEIERQIRNDDICALNQKFYYYYFNLRKGHWNKAAASLKRNLKVSPQITRGLMGRPQIDEAGWHFSYLMSPEQIARKIEAFSHQEFNSPKFVDTQRIAERVEKRIDLFDRNQSKLRVEPIDDSFPLYLRQNADHYSHYILPFEKPVVSASGDSNP